MTEGLGANINITLYAWTIRPLGVQNRRMGTGLPDAGNKSLILQCPSNDQSIRPALLHIRVMLSVLVSFSFLE